MGLEIVSTAEFNAFKQEFRKEMQEIKALLADNQSIGSDKKWLKTKEFMEKFDINSLTTLEKLRARGEVKAKKKIGTWYYDADSYLK